MYSLLNDECIPVFLGVMSQRLLNGWSRIQENIHPFEYTVLYKSNSFTCVVTSSLSLTCRRHLRHTTDTTQTASQAPVSRTTDRACATQGSVFRNKKANRRHALVHGPSLGLGYKHIRPDRPRKRKTAKDEADITTQVRFVWVHATRSTSWSASVRVRARHPTHAQIGNDNVGEHTTEEVGSDGDTGRLGPQLGRRDFRKDHVAQRPAVRRNTSHVPTRLGSKQLTCQLRKQSSK